MNEDPVTNQDGQDDRARPQSESQRSEGKEGKAETGKRGGGESILPAQKQTLLCPQPFMVRKRQGKHWACSECLNTDDL